jgi:hypothetical protein
LIARDIAPVVRVVAIVAIISQHEILIGWHRPTFNLLTFPPPVFIELLGTKVVGWLIFYIIFPERLTVDIDAVPLSPRPPRQGDQSAA